MKKTDLSPVRPSERFVILDALRGFSILGIALANFPEFSLYTFLSAEDAAALPASGADQWIRYGLYVLVDGKFYTLFSLLFGIGFSIILHNVARKGGNAIRVFFRRMGLLALIGFLHLMGIWIGDILLLYALLGMCLPLFRKLSDRWLLGVAAALLCLPVGIDFVCEITHTDLSASVVRLQQMYCAQFGITDENFAYWLHDASNYREVFQFLIQGAVVRLQEFIDGNRYFKVMGLFLIGYYLGRQRLYARLEEKKHALKEIFRIGAWVGFSSVFVLCLECPGWSSLGTEYSQPPLFFERISAGLFLCGGILPVVSAPSSSAVVPMAGCSRTDGTEQLHRTVGGWNGNFLRHRSGTGGTHQPAVHRGDCTGRISFPAVFQPKMAHFLPFWPVGMDLENVDLRALDRLPETETAYGGLKHKKHRQG